MAEDPQNLADLKKKRVNQTVTYIRIGQHYSLANA